MKRRYSWGKGKNAIFCISLWVGILCFLPALVSSEQFPPPRGAVNDFAGVLSAPARDKMEALAREVWEKTGTAIVVAVMPTIGDNEVNDYVNRLYSAWGIGKKGQDKGVLIFVTVKERKMRIETGYGVEGILPDGLVGEIRDKYIIPYLRNGDYDTGLFKGMVAIAQVVAKEAGVTLTGTPSLPHRPQKSRPRGGFDPLTLLILAIAAWFFFGTRAGRRILPWLILFSFTGSGRSTSGGNFGGFGGGFGGFGGGMSGGGGAGGSY